MAVVWGIVLGVIYFLLKRNLTNALIIGLAVVSHWVLDLLVHIPDLPLYPGSSVLLGFGLWNYKILEILIEVLIFMFGLRFYLQVTNAKNKTGKYGFWALIIFLSIIYISNIFGPPPPSVKAIAWAGELQWLFVIWAYWVDKNRILKKS
jgi:hypothetical protein